MPEDTPSPEAPPGGTLAWICSDPRRHEQYGYPLGWNHAELDAAVGRARRTATDDTSASVTRGWRSPSCAAGRAPISFLAAFRECGVADFIGALERICTALLPAVAVPGSQ